jgi:hypothetical protein
LGEDGEEVYDRAMRIDWVIPAARCAELAGDGTMSILGAGIDTLLLPTQALPTRCEMFLALRVAGPEDEWASGRHILSATLISPSGGKQEVMRHRLAPPPPRRITRKHPQTVVAHLDKPTA